MGKIEVGGTQTLMRLDLTNIGLHWKVWKWIGTTLKRIGMLFGFSRFSLMLSTLMDI